ncbi:UDP-3-O-acylglucosamine N-acyltransferase [Striga asiatica]|uniref:UDP-3-O-acylglucosamine N-acyltransferase n=1 Tax=Striga asiatica TaxID=4170 RepID=A0A5A7PVL4_STRAF|nr:UDP-3-O-acylglucosamine N-acyltransferase [Striga asiatica]
MVANHHFTRIDTLEIKEHIFRMVGPQRAEKYFDQLKRFFAMKLSKAEFDRNCIRAIGRENLPLHNKLIRSILQNASQAKVPPQKPQKPEKLSINQFQSLYGNRKFRDRPSPLGPLGKSPSLTCEETFTRTQEQLSATELQSIGSRPPVLEEGEEVEQLNESLDFRRWGLITAPIGVSVSSGEDRKNNVPFGFTFDDLREKCENSGDLPDTASLRSRLQKKFASEGMGISLESVNLLNNGLDAFLKRLIEPCVGIAGSRKMGSSCILGGQYNFNNNQVMSGFNGGKFVGRPSKQTNVSMLDFRVAMESNPRVLGEDWPLQLEKIFHYSIMQELKVSAGN